MIQAAAAGVAAVDSHVKLVRGTASDAAVLADARAAVHVHGSKIFFDEVFAAGAGIFR